MLALGRTPGQYVVIGADIVIQVVEISGELRLAIEAPRNIRIQRGEVYEKNHCPPRCIKRKATVQAALDCNASNHNDIASRLF